MLHALLGHTVLGYQEVHGLGLDISMELENLGRGSYCSEGHVGKGFYHPVIACLELIEEDCTCFMVEMSHGKCKPVGPYQSGAGSLPEGRVIAGLGGLLPGCRQDSSRLIADIRQKSDLQVHADIVHNGQLLGSESHVQEQFHEKGITLPGECCLPFLLPWLASGIT